jgi:hypothetical protein
MIKVEEASIKTKGDSSPFHPLPPTKLNNIFMCVEDLNEEIHTGQTGAFLHTSQRGNLYIMIAIHLNANYIFASLWRTGCREKRSGSTKRFSTGWKQQGCD